MSKWRDADNKIETTIINYMSPLATTPHARHYHHLGLDQRAKVVINLTDPTDRPTDRPTVAPPKGYLKIGHFDDLGGFLHRNKIEPDTQELRFC